MGETSSKLLGLFENLRRWLFACSLWKDGGVFGVEVQLGRREGVAGQEDGKRVIAAMRSSSSCGQPLSESGAYCQGPVVLWPVIL